MKYDDGIFLEDHDPVQQKLRADILKEMVYLHMLEYSEFVKVVDVEGVEFRDVGEGFSRFSAVLRLDDESKLAIDPPQLKYALESTALALANAIDFALLSDFLKKPKEVQDVYRQWDTPEGDILADVEASGVVNGDGTVVFYPLKLFGNVHNPVVKEAGIVELDKDRFGITLAGSAKLNHLGCAFVFGKQYGILKTCMVMEKSRNLDRGEDECMFVLYYKIVPYNPGHVVIHGVCNAGTRNA